MFPTLRQAGLEIFVINRLNAEHDEISALIDQFNTAFPNFAAVEPDVINNDLRRLAEALQAHLSYEETHACPLLTRLSQ